MTLLDRIFDVRVLVAVVLAAVLGLFVVLNQDDGKQPSETGTTPAGLTVTPVGDDVNRLSPIKVVFRDPPAEQDASKLVSLEPEVDGEYVWQDDRTVLFQPDFPGLLRGFEYTISVSARPEAGLKEDFSTTFRTEGKLEVANVIPAPNDVEVPEGVQVLVQFTRSVVPLTVLSEQPEGEVLVFDPPLEGTGEWLNTSLYRFVPAEDAIEPNTTYSVTVPAAAHRPARRRARRRLHVALQHLRPCSHQGDAGPRYRVRGPRPGCRDHVQPGDGPHVRRSRLPAHEDHR